MKLSSVLLAYTVNAGLFSSKRCPLLVDEEAKADWPKNIGTFGDIQDLSGVFFVVKSTPGLPFAQIQGECPRITVEPQEVNSMKLTYIAQEDVEDEEDQSTETYMHYESKYLYQYDSTHTNAMTLMKLDGQKLSGRTFNNVKRDYRGLSIKQDFDNFVVVGYAKDIDDNIQVLVMNCKQGGLFSGVTYDAMVLVESLDADVDQLLNDAEDTFKTFKKSQLVDNEFDNGCVDAWDDVKYDEKSLKHLTEPCNGLGKDCVTLINNYLNLPFNGLKLKTLEHFTPEFQFDFDILVKTDTDEHEWQSLFDVDFDGTEQGTYQFIQKAEEHTINGVVQADKATKFVLFGIDSDDQVWGETCSDALENYSSYKIVFRQRQMPWGHQLQVIIDGEVKCEKEFGRQDWSHDEITVNFGKGKEQSYQGNTISGFMALSTIKNFTYRKLEGYGDL